MGMRAGFIAVAMASQFFISRVSAGSEIELLINMLHENGTVSDVQYGRLTAELEQNKKQNQQLQKQLDEKLAEATKPSDVDVQVKGGLRVSTRDDAFSTELGGRLQIDAASYGGDPAMGDGTEVRRAYLRLQGTMYHDWGYRLQYNFANTGSNGKGIVDAYIDYKGFNYLNLRVGHFKEPFTLHEATSDNFVTFTERALLAAFSPGRTIGAMASHVQSDLTWAIGVFGDSVDKKEGSNDEDWGASARVTVAPINETGRLIHLGLAANYRDSGEAGTVRFKQAPETRVSGTNIVDTGLIMDTKDVMKLGVELAGVWGPLSAQAEYISTSVNRNGLNDVDFDGWYVETGYFLTGESRQYKNGKFTRPKPFSNIGEDGTGAWQLALRYTTIDLNDGMIDGGETDAMTVGLNWYPTPTLRFTANYVDVLEIDGGPFDRQEPRILQVRSQWAF